MSPSKTGLDSGGRHALYLGSALRLGSLTIPLADYATTGLRIVTVGPSGIGKTNAGLLVAEQLAAQGWVSVLMDPEGQIADLYKDREDAEILVDAGKLEAHLRGRHHPILVVKVRHADAFVTFGRVVMRVADETRQPVFLMVDEAQMFSASRKRKEAIGEATDLTNDMVERGRKRALDLFFTCHRFSGTLNRSIFHNKNLTFVGRQEDPTAWSALAPQFKGSAIGFAELSALAPGEFFCFSRRGVEKVVMPMAAALEAVAPPAPRVTPARPSTFQQWDRALRQIADERLLQLTPPVVDLLARVSGLTAAQIAAGNQALADEIGARP